jgi:Skp family chaperone for outer membrane proteins
MLTFTSTTTTKDPLFDLFDTFQDKVKKTLETEFNKLSSELTEHFTKLEQISGTISKSLGRGRDFAFGMRQTFADAMPDVIKLGGKLEDIQKIQGDAISATGRGVQLAAEEFSKLYATTQVLNTDASDLFSTFKKIGTSIHDVGKESEKIINIAQQYGVNVEQVYDGVSRNIEKINAYNFQNGVEGLAKMAAKATALKIDMGTTFDFADKVMDPEGAINMANAFQRLGAGTSALLDPLKLMDLSMNDPEELQNQLVKMTQQYTKFNKETGKFEITNKRMFRELAKELGMSYNELTKMALGGADLDRKSVV